MENNSWEKPKEFWLGETEAMWHVADSYLDTQDWPMETVHVVEYRAYNQAVYELDKARQQRDEAMNHVDRLNKLLDSYSVHGSDGCKNCETGRITIYARSRYCLGCQDKIRVREGHEK